MDRYYELRQALSSIEDSQVADSIDEILDGARINADETVFVERASDDWETIFVGTIVSTLSCQANSAAVVRFFADNGINY